MLGKLVIEETGMTTGLRVLSSDGGESKVEVTLRSEGQVNGIPEVSLWTYWSRTRADGSIYGEGVGVMTTRDGDVVNMTGNGSAKSMESDGSVKYRGAIHYHTASAKLASLNGTVGVHEYAVGADGNTVIKVWEWR